jgi:hypothetical protein
MTAKGNACRVLVEKPEEKLPLGTRRLRWENDIKKVKEIGKEA